MLLVNVLTTPGLDVVGPFPAELQQGSRPHPAPKRKGDAAKALIVYLKSPDVTAIIKVKGMTPG